MGIEDLRWFHWLPIGLALGAAIGGTLLGTRESLADSAARTIGRSELENVLAIGLPDGRPAVTDLVVHPPRGDGVWWLTGQRTKLLQLHADPTDAASPLVDAEVRTPFKMPAANVGIWDELKHLHTDFPQTAPSPSYAWHDAPAIHMSLWTAGLGIVVGGLWPPMMAFLIGAGFGRRPNDPAYDLDAFATETAPPPPVSPSDQTVHALDALLEGLAADATANSAPIAGPIVTPTASVPAPLTPSAQPLDAPIATPDEPPKDYAGQFYPTQVHAPAPRPSGR